MPHDLPQDVDLLPRRLQHLLGIVGVGGADIDNLRRVLLSALLVDASSDDRRNAAKNSREKLLINCIGRGREGEGLEAFDRHSIKLDNTINEASPERDNGSPFYHKLRRRERDIERCHPETTLPGPSLVTRLQANAL